MKKILWNIFVLTLLLANSCKKSNTPANSWTFKGTVYSVASSSSPSATAIAYSCTNPPGNIQFNFGTTSAPTAGSYQITGSLFPTLAQVGIVLSNSSGITYNATGSGNQNVTVSVSPAGKISCSLPSGGAMLYGGVSNDSAVVTGTLTQP